MTLPISEFRFECNSAFVIVTGDPWVVVDFNPTAIKWFENKLKRNQPLSVQIVCNEKALRKRLQRGRVASFELEVMGDFKLPVLFTLRQLDQGSEGLEPQYLLEGQDLTRAKSAEHMLTTYSHMIEEKTRELEAAISARDAFLSAMSHELRTPLNLMIGFSESLLDEVYGELSEAQNEVIQKIYTSGLSLYSLLTNLLSLSRIRSGKLNLNRQAVDLVTICDHIIDQYEEAIELKQLKFSIEGTPCCQPYVDEQWSEQMISNLLSNAIKFTPENKSIGIRFSTSEKLIRITVWDHGIGIPISQQSKIFQPFFQVDSTLARGYEGSGLGLSLVAEIVRLHGGIVSVESKLGFGSQFHLDLPCHAVDIDQ